MEMKASPSKLCIALSSLIAISSDLIIGTNGFPNVKQFSSISLPLSKTTETDRRYNFRSHFGGSSSISSTSRGDSRGSKDCVSRVEIISMPNTKWNVKTESSLDQQTQNPKLSVNQQQCQQLSSQDRQQFVVSHSRRRTIGFIALLGLVGTSCITNTQPVLAVASPAQQQTDECLNGDIAAEQTIPGAYQNICMGLPQRSITLKSTGDNIRIYQGSVGGAVATMLRDGSGENGILSTGTASSSSYTSTSTSAPPPPPLSSNNESSVTGRTGVALWNSGLLLARLLDEIAVSATAATVSKQQYQGEGELVNLFKGKTVVELGCGTGLNSIIASKLGAKYVYATDGNMEVLELAKLNLEQNNIVPSFQDNINKNVGETGALQWGSLDSVDFYDTADVILGSDLTYNAGSWRILADTLNSVLKANGYFLYLTLGHSGFNVSGELNGFLTVVQSGGSLEVVDESSSRWPFPGVGSLELLLNSSLSEKEKNVVKSTGGYKIIVLRKRLRKQLK